MHTESFDIRHLSDINEWRKARDMGPILTTSKRGHMTYYRGEPVAVAFLCTTEGDIGILDGLCTNPDFPGDLRSSAIDLVVQAVMNEALTLGLKAVIAWSKDKNTLLRSHSHGFVEVPQTLIVADLSRKAQERL